MFSEGLRISIFVTLVSIELYAFLHFGIISMVLNFYAYSIFPLLTTNASRAAIPGVSSHSINAFTEEPSTHRWQPTTGSLPP